LSAEYRSVGKCTTKTNLFQLKQRFYDLKYHIILNIKVLYQR